MPRIELDRTPAIGTPPPRGRRDDPEFEPLLTRYIEGWAEVNLLKIISSVSENYMIVDPLVGIFNRNSLPAYVQILRERVGFNTVRSIRTKVYLGAMRSPASSLIRRFWRSLPECGLAGHSEIQLWHGRVARELVSYDPNIATERLRCGSNGMHADTAR